MDCTGSAVPSRPVSTSTTVEQRNRFSTSEVLDIIELDEPVGADSDDSLDLDLESL